MADTATLIHQFDEPVRAADGGMYVAQVWAEADGSRVHAWIVFIAADGRILRTARETTRRDRDGVRAWARRLHARRLRDALARAVPSSAELPAA